MYPRFYRGKMLLVGFFAYFVSYLIGLAIPGAGG